MRRADWFAVTALLLFAAGLRITGLSYGRPEPEYFPSYAPKGMTHELLPIHPDEFFLVSVPVNMALRNRLNPEFFDYPSFIINTNLALNWLTDALDGQSLEDRAGKNLRAYAAFPLYLISRMYSVFGGLLQAACAYAIARMLANRYAALCAGLLVAVSYTLVQHGHYIKPGSLAAGWMMLAAWSSLAALHARTSPWRFAMLILAGVATGLAATTRYNAVAVAPMLLCVSLILLYRHRSRSMMRAVLLSWLLVPLVFFAFSPYVLRDFQHFWEKFSYVVISYTAANSVELDHYVVDHWRGLAYLVAFTAEISLGFLAMAAAGISLGLAWARRPAGSLLRGNSLSLGIALLCAVILPYAFFALRNIRVRSDTVLLLILPFVAVLAGIGADWLARRIKLPSRLSMPLVALLLIIQPLIFSVQIVEMFTQPDTRQIMLEWIHEHIPPGARFFLNGPYNVPLDEAIYPYQEQFLVYAPELPEPADYDYMIYADTLLFDVLRSQALVPPEVVEQERDYLLNLDRTYQRIAEIRRPDWFGADYIVNMAAHWHNPGLILYCVNPDYCEAAR